MYIVWQRSYLAQQQLKEIINKSLGSEDKYKKSNKDVHFEGNKIQETDQLFLRTIVKTLRRKEVRCKY